MKTLREVNEGLIPPLFRPIFRVLEKPLSRANGRMFWYRIHRLEKFGLHHESIVFILRSTTERIENPDL